MRKKVNHWDSYGVFCIANAIIQDDFIQLKEIDRLFDDSIELYDQFLRSKFYTLSHPELECIYSFLKHLNVISKIPDEMPTEVLINY